MKRITTPALTAYFAGRTLSPIGFLPNGRPVFPIAGGAEDDPPQDKGGDDKGGKDDQPADYKPPATQADLDRIISERLRRQAETKFGDYDDLRTKAAEADKAREAAMSDAERAVEAARKEGESAAQERANARLIRSEARALAATAKFRDPSDAVAFLDLAKVSVNDEGDVDAKAIRDQLKTLADSKPYLVDDGKTPRPKPDKGQGGTGGGETPSVARGRDLWEERRGKKKTA